jgi:hypothetical protein
MNKDIIYIDVEDDITAIIGKVKDARQKIVALVPPKRIGVLQSAVNLRLLARAASQSDKHLVIISSNPALVALAAAARLPVAKNLQSKPEVAEIAALDIDDGEDVIDGAQLPVGDLAKTADAKPAHLVSVHDPAIDAAIDENAAEDTSRRALPPAPGQLPKKARSKSGIKVPNFGDFRKKLALIIAGGVLLIGFLIWGIFFAPRASVQITARTSDSSVNNKVTLANDVTTDVVANTLKVTTQQTKKAESVEFEATGSRDAGNKAAGTMKLTRTNPSGTPLTVPAGTTFVSGERTFVSTETAVLVTKLTADGLDPGTSTVAVLASAIGDEFNLSARSYQPGVSGITAQGSEMSGGTHKIIKVVSAEDIQKATDQLKAQDTAAIKKQLGGQLGEDVVAIDQTFRADQAAPVSVPAVDQEVPAGAKPKLTSEITYSFSGVDKNELADYLDAHFAKQLDGLDDQRVYNNGAGKVTFTNVTVAEKGFTGNVVATAKIGPKIEDAEVKDKSKGKRYGEIQSSLEAIQGVESVDVKFWPFWVTTAPNDAKRINVEFKLNES